MKVEILNPEVVRDLYHNHGVFACTCYATHEKYADKVGESCQKTGHMSGSRCEYIKFRISDLDRGTAEQCLRHEIGSWVPFEMQDSYSFADFSELVQDISPDQIVKNMASFRYIDKGGFHWETPANIKKFDDVREIYDAGMRQINEMRRAVKDALEKHGIDPKKANEDANMMLPRATTTEFVIGLTPEALIRFCHKRLCTRAQEFMRSVALGMKQEVEKYNKDFADRELKPHCQHLMWCPEGSRCCGAAPTKEQLAEIIASNVR